MKIFSAMIELCGIAFERNEERMGSSGFQLAVIGLTILLLALLSYSGPLLG